MKYKTETGIDDFYSKKIKEIQPKELKLCSGNMPVHKVAQFMAHEKISCVFVGESTSEIGGFVTDITLRDNVIANKLSLDLPVKEIMDTSTVAISEEAYVYEALLLMFQTKTRYLLVNHQGNYVGVISRNKILTEQSQSPFIFIQSVKQAVNKNELKRKWAQVPGIVYQLIQRGVKAEIVNQIISTIADTITLRVVENILKEKSTPPARFVFIALGSEGRQEQTLQTDQDNAIIYEDKANEQRELVRTYFLDFAEKVSETLDYIGFHFCEGGFMAKNPKWTHSLSHWKRNYRNWFQESSQETVMQYATFFDCRAIYGDFFLLDDLKIFMDEQLQDPLERFFYNMAQNTLNYNPQLTWLKNIRTFKVDNEEVFDIKKAMSPMVEIIRLYALHERIFETNTGQRLKILESKKVFNQNESAELYQAYYSLMALRLEKQAERLMNEGKAPRNFIPIGQLTKVQMVTIKEIFKVIKDFQLKIKIQFTKSF